MSKRKKRRVRKSGRKHTTKRATRRKKRRHSANPTRKKRTHRRRSAARRRHAASNPRRRRRGKRRHVVRAHMSNPRRRRSHGKRRHRRNPSIPKWATYAIAVALGLATFSGTQATVFAISRKLDPTLQTLERNRYIAGGLALAGGVGLAFLSLPIGLCVAAGGLCSLFGTDLSIALMKVLDPEPIKGVGKMGAVYGNVGGYEAMGAYERQMSGYLPMGAVYGNVGGMGAVYGNIGAMVPAPPWQSSSPF